MVTTVIPLLVIAVAAAAEWWHMLRCRRVAYLAFGPQGAARHWTRIAPVARVATLGLLAWGLLVLLFDGRNADMSNTAQPALQHLVLCLDVSPSMQIADAGPHGEQRRSARAAEVLRSILAHVDMHSTRVTVIPFYSSARPVVVDAADPEVVANILNDLPLEHLFARGKTNLFTTLEAANPVAAEWRRSSATLLVVSDGDTLPPGNIPVLVPAYRQALIIGVGDGDRGTFIDGHDSRQDAGSLRQLAGRVNGKYIDANERMPPSEAIAWFAKAPAISGTSDSLSNHDLAIVSILAAAFVLALLGPALALAGSGWKPVLAANQSQPQIG
ncbi:MAG: VWA domain-containing protein [Planctomycetia bacterium]|nr:VWA domain-containing protein [Planctomycetia bacterium]